MSKPLYLINSEVLTKEDFGLDTVLRISNKKEENSILLLAHGCIASYNSESTMFVISSLAMKEAEGATPAVSVFPFEGVVELKEHFNEETPEGHVVEITLGELKAEAEKDYNKDLIEELPLLEGAVLGIETTISAGASEDGQVLGFSLSAYIKNEMVEHVFEVKENEKTILAPIGFNVGYLAYCAAITGKGVDVTIDEVLENLKSRNVTSLSLLAIGDKLAGISKSLLAQIKVEDFYGALGVNPPAVVDATAQVETPADPVAE